MILRLLIFTLLVQHSSGFLGNWIDNLKNKVKEITEKVKEEFNDLKEDVRDLIQDARNFANVKIEDLKGMKQDLLSNLETVKGMTKEQFNGIRSRFKNFRSDNLESLFKNVNFTLIKDNIKDFASETWEKIQVNVLAKISLEKYGKDVANWTKDQIKSLKGFLKGLPTYHFSKFSKTALNESLDAFCDASLSLQQKAHLLISSIKIFGKVEKWDDAALTRLCENIEGLTPEEILKIPAKEISDAIDKFTKHTFSKSQREAILKKMKEHLGDIKDFTKEQFESLKDLVEDLDVDDIKKFTKEQLKEIKDVTWDKIQAGEYLKKLKEEFGEVKDWSQEQIENAFKAIPRLGADFNVSIPKIWNAITKKGKTALWNLKQQWKLKKEDAKQFAKFVEKDIRDRVQIIEAYLDTDIKFINKNELLDAINEIKKKIEASEPIMRRVVNVFMEKTTKDLETLGQFLKGISPHELSQINIADTVEEIFEDLGEIRDKIPDLAKAQVLELMQKVRDKAGLLNKTDTEDKDKMDWGFQNLKKLGKIALAFTRKEMGNFPFTGFESAMDVLGKHSGWARRKVLAVMNRTKEYWETTGKTLSMLEESDIEMLGSFVQGFSLSDLKELKDEVKPMVIELMGKFEGLPVDRLKEVATFSFDFLKKLSKDEIQPTDLKIMGNLLFGLSSDAIKAIKGTTLYNSAKDVLEEAVRNQKEKMKEGIKQKLRDYYEALKQQIKDSEISRWTIDDFRKILPSVIAMKVDEIKAIGKDVFMVLLDEVADIRGWDEDQKNAIIEKVKETYGEFNTLSGEILDKMKSVISALKDSDIAKLTKEQIIAMQDKLGDEEFTKQTAEKFVKRLKEIGFEDVSAFTMETWQQLRNVLTGYSVEDIKNHLTIDSVDKLNLLGSLKGWSKEQLVELKKKAKTFLDNSQNKVNDYTSLKNIVKGFTDGEIQNIPDDVFRVAAWKFGQLKNIEKETAKALLKKAKKVWNNKWTDSRVDQAGGFLIGLDKSDVPNLPESSIEYITDDVINNMDADQLKGFTVEQLFEFNSEQVAAIPAEVRNAMPPAKAEALKSVEYEEKTNDDDDDSASGMTNPSFYLLFSLCTFLLTYMMV